MACLLFVPAHDERKLQKAMQLPCSGVILDLEDSVHPSQKQAARHAMLEAVGKHRVAGKRLYVRINGLHTSYWQDDVSSATRIRPDGIVVPKAEHTLRTLDEYVKTLQANQGPLDFPIHWLPLLETATAIMDMEAILASSPLISAAAIGMADLALDLGTSWEDLSLAPSPLLVSAREKLALVSRKLHLSPPWDSVFMKLDDPEALRKDTQIGKRLGFQGKHVIHPSQIEVVNDVYRISEAEYTKAKDILAAMEDNGALQMDGQLVDEPVLQRARQIVARYEEMHA
ncbi:HpcH/HpaI aldolase/citrate lyase family protein [Alicyclobacillus hesperidum]|uniref:HpcH/HpaI aldolase/citrate lyase family protein n=1 Tax=Alicyclobacillus hesperidum TaxID=89784 RepID=UPI0002D4E126|nr:CoA ester lyase [Alicyclobacillus hesperidum]